jgi:hypothetical protein
MISTTIPLSGMLVRMWKPGEAEPHASRWAMFIQAILGNETRRHFRESGTCSSGHMSSLNVAKQKWTSKVTPNSQELPFIVDDKDLLNTNAMGKCKGTRKWCSSASRT